MLVNSIIFLVAALVEIVVIIFSGVGAICCNLVLMIDSIFEVIAQVFSVSFNETKTVFSKLVK